MLMARKFSHFLAFCVFTQAAELTQVYLPAAIVQLLHICNELIGNSCGHCSSHESLGAKGVWQGCGCLQAPVAPKEQQVCQHG